ncbi:MAG TPA: ATP-binding protein [Candidatus Deferrimicrobium sp.]|nr:ATP-binding protein [Candidatus Deferrimicrobium sp.]
MPLKFESLKRNRRVILLMMTVILPGLVISGLGLFYVSQQRKARDLNLREKYDTTLALIRDETERQIETAIDNTFKLISVRATLASVENQDSLQNLMKEILLQNPVVKYPFLISHSGSYIFPFTGKATFLKGTVITPEETLFKYFSKLTGKNSAFYRLFKQAENFELKERNYPAAIQYYLEALAKVKDKQIMFYVYHAIARCYYKLNKFPQAAAYVSDILRHPPGVSEANTSLYSIYPMALYLAARVYQQMDLQDRAVECYLRLYDETLRFEYETTTGKETFAFFKNEALDYLLRHIKNGEKQEDRQRFDRVRAMEGLENLSELDIDLRWEYFDAAESNMQTSVKGRNTLTFDKLREFYLPTDAKTLFYKEVKDLKLWTRTGTLPEKARQDIVYTKISKAARNNSPATEPVFGFMLSFDYITSRVLPPIVKKHLADEPLMVSMEDKNKPIDPVNPVKTYALTRLPFKRFYSDSDLVLSSLREGYIESVVKKEMWINYGLIAAIISLLLLGVWFFYKYTMREAELVRLKSDFVDSASHTLKTPLTRIRLMAEKLELDWIKDEAKKKEYFRAILSETDRMSEMVTNMLDFSKVEAGRMRFEMKKGNLREYIQSVMDSLRPHIEGLGFQLKIQLANDIPPLYFDPEGMKSILVNLVHNALKYSREEKYIGVQLYQEGQRVVMAVEDRGMGIPEKERENIFEKFYRVWDDTVKAMEGSGLGLFLVRHAVKAHKGEIKVISEPGKGSTFKVYLPCNREQRYAASGGQKPFRERVSGLPKAFG